MRTYINSRLENHDIALYFDEASDVNSNKILHIMARPIDSENFTKPLLIDSIKMPDGRAETYVSLVNLSLGRIFPRNSDMKRIQLLVTDGSPVCLAAGQKMKLMYPNMRHVVCLCHNLHLLAETMREK